MLSTDKLAERLRAACNKLRTTSMPLADMIPLMQQAADALEAKPAPAEPVAWLVLDESGALVHAAAYRESAHEHINDAINEHGITEAARWVVRPAFAAAPAPWVPTDAELLAEAEFTESYDASAPSFQSLLRDDAIVGDFRRRLLICMRAAIAASKGGKP
jgi:hypothetical protein